MEIVNVTLTGAGQSTRLEIPKAYLTLKESWAGGTLPTVSILADLETLQPAAIAREPRSQSGPAVETGTETLINLTAGLDWSKRRIWSYIVDRELELVGERDGLVLYTRKMTEAMTRLPESDKRMLRGEFYSLTQLGEDMPVFAECPPDNPTNKYLRCRVHGDLNVNIFYDFDFPKIEFERWRIHDSRIRAFLRAMIKD